jgi:flagellar basal body P-ring protein FlgI
MPGKTVLCHVAGIALCLACAGCDKMTFPPMFFPTTQPEADQIPPEIAGTVAEYASVVAGGEMLLDGHGLVVGLGNKGSSEVPPQLKKYLIEYMLKQKVGSALSDTSGITPSQILADKDTAVVRMIAAVPPGAPKGWIFDVRVSALSRTGTRSLDGGTMLPFPMFQAIGEGVAPSSGARAWAMAEGGVFVNPFLDSRKSSDTALFRQGRLIGGGKVLQARPVRLVMREPDYARCNLIQKRINQRFGGSISIANATNPSTIELKIPAAYDNDYEHFLELVVHLPLQSEPGRWDARAREIADEMRKARANCEGLALVWEAMGPQVIGVCRTQYASKNPTASFYAARTGLRLKDDMAGEVLVRFASSSGSPFQVPAIEELGRQPWMPRSVIPLRKLIDDDSVLVRIAAYEALVKLGDTSLITRTDFNGEFSLDVVTSRRGYVVYATQTHDRRLVLFGRDMAIVGQVFFSMPDDMVTIADKMVPVNAKGVVKDPKQLTEDEKTTVKREPRLMVFRTIPRTGGISEPFYSDFLVRSLVTTLGSRAEKDSDGKIKGLEFTYGQIVAILYRLCAVDKDIPAKFVLQQPPGRERIYGGAATAGRPDMPGE